jgi:hypothetical protein
MTENEKLCAMYADGLIEREDVPPELWHRPRKHRKPRPPSLAIALKQAKAKGMDLTVAPDGSMMFKKSQPEIIGTMEKNEWDQEYGPH